MDAQNVCPKMLGEPAVRWPRSIAIGAWSAKIDTNSICLSEKGRTLMISDQQRAPHARDLGKARPVPKRLIAGADLRSPLVWRRRFGPGSPARPKAPHQGP